MANENKPISGYPVETTITANSKVLGINDAGKARLFTLAQLRTNNIGQFKTTDAAPPTPLLNQNYTLIGTAMGQTPSGTYTNLLMAASTPLVIPAAAASHGILNAHAVWNGTFWVPVWQDVTLPTTDISGKTDNTDFIPVKSSVDTLKGLVQQINIPGYQTILSDAQNHKSFAITDDGTTEIQKINLPNGGIVYGFLDSSVKGLIFAKVNHPDYETVFADSLGNMSGYIKKDGTWKFFKLDAPIGGVGYASLDSYLQTLKPLQGKTALLIGDSITALGVYQPYLAALTGMTLVNHAKGGISVQQMIMGDGAGGFPALTVADVTGKDIITLFGGLNNRSLPVGVQGDLFNPSDSSGNTTYGVFQYAINTIYSLLATAGNTTCRLVIICPHKVGKYGYIPFDGGQIYNGHTLLDMVNAMQTLCGFYGIPTIDLFRRSGIGNYTWDYMMSNALDPASPNPTIPDQVHPNSTKGAKAIGQLIGTELIHLFNV